MLTTYKEDVGHEQVMSEPFALSLSLKGPALRALRGCLNAIQVSQLLSSSGLPPVAEADFKTAVHYSFIVVAAYALKPPSALPDANGARKARTAYTVAAEPGSVQGMHLVGYTRYVVLLPLDNAVLVRSASTCGGVYLVSPMTGHDAFGLAYYHSECLTCRNSRFFDNLYLRRLAW